MPNQSHVTLSLAHISQVDGGRVAIAFNQALRQILLDCQDRPELDKTRKVCLEVEISPVCDQRELVSCDVEFNIKSSNPSKRTRTYPMLPTSDGLAFSPDIPDNPLQRPLGFESE